MEVVTMEVNVNVGKEAAAQTLTPTPEQIAAFLANQQPTNNSVALDDNGAAEESTPAATNTTPTVDQLRLAFDAAMASDIYRGNPKRLERLLEALKIPMSNEKDFNQFLNHAKKELMVKAAMTAANSGTTVVLPTEEEITAEAKKRFALKLQKEAEKAARKTK
jgi:hypothetical protein